MMQPPVKSALKTNACHDTELSELYRVRDAAWESQRSSGKTGTCDFLDLLLRVHQAILALERLKELTSARPGHEVWEPQQSRPTDPARIHEGPAPADKILGMPSSAPPAKALVPMSEPHGTPTGLRQTAPPEKKGGKL